MARKSFLATVVGIVAFAVPNAFADKGGIPHEGSSGQGRPAAQQQTAATAPHGKALAKGHAKSHSNAKANAHAKSHSNAKANAHANGHSNAGAAKPSTQGPPASNTHAKAGKTTICHATGSEKNPYVEITISNHAIPAHSRHQDGRDIIPAPATGCPGTATEPAQTQAAAPGSSDEQAPPPVTGSSAESAGAQTLVEGVEMAKPRAFRVSVLGAHAVQSAASPRSRSRIRVLGASAASAPVAAVTPTRDTGSGLPFTGFQLGLVIAIALAVLLAGLTLRRASRLARD